MSEQYPECRLNFFVKLFQRLEALALSSIDEPAGQRLQFLLKAKHRPRKRYRIETFLVPSDRTVGNDVVEREGKPPRVAQQIIGSCAKIYQRLQQSFRDSRHLRPIVRANGCGKLLSKRSIGERFQFGPSDGFASQLVEAALRHCSAILRASL